MEGYEHAFCQVEGLNCIPFAPASAKDDKEVLAAMQWGPAFPDAVIRLSQFYMQNLLRAIPLGDPRRHISPITSIFGFANHIDSLIRSSDRRFWKLEWHEDTFETITEAIELFKDNVDVRLLKRIGENLISIADEKITAIEIAMEDYLLNEVYVASLGTSEGRILGPLVSIAEWDKTLRDTGFSGVDTYSPTSHQFSHPTAVFVTQAVDNQVSYIQDPLSQPLPQAIQIAQDELVIIRGKGQQTRDLVAELFLDFKDISTLSATAVATEMFRFKAQAAVINQQEGGEPMFGNLKRELVLDAQGQLLIPRLKPGKDMNDHLNSDRRSISKTMQLDQSGRTSISLKLQQPIKDSYFVED
ncbi:hypothetical protein J3E71DRAFT_340427 [Bipolaris maydis]|nr:hypothetical protein J3E71DRAFT_340427 [Bipolaris maydis]